MRELYQDGRVAPIFFYDSLGSTNTELKALALKGAPEGSVVIAARQTAGRGRMERVFQSPEGGVYLSMLLHPGTDAEASLSLTPCAAVAAARTVEALCGIYPGIKWPNDLLCQGRKLCGILCQSVFFQGKQFLVLGVGLNVSTPPEAFSPELREGAASILSLTGSAPSPESAARELVVQLDRMYCQWKSAPRSFLDEYRQRCVSLHRPVKLICNGSATDAYALDIDENYALVVEYPDGARESISCGEVSLR